MDQMDWWILTDFMWHLFYTFAVMTTLFPPVFPPGFEYEPDFLTKEEEQYLLSVAKSVPLHNFLFQGFEAKRRVASFGHDYSFDTRTLSEGTAIPAPLIPLVVKVAKKLSIPPESVAELLVTEYPVGSVINWHRDAPPFELIAGVSLGAPVKFRLRPHDKNKQSRGSIISVDVAPRSLYVMKGPSRTDWEHSTTPVSAVRHSITLRTLRTQLES